MSESKLAAAYVEIGGRTKGFEQSLGESRSALSKFASDSSKSSSMLATAMGTAIGGGIVAAGHMAIEAVKGIASSVSYAVEQGASLHEMISASEHTFGESSGIISKAAEKQADAFGMVRSEYYRNAMQLGLLGQAMGKSEQDSAVFANRFLQLAADVSSFRHIPVADAMAAISSGIEGMSRPLRGLGVFLSEGRTEAMAYAMTGKKVGESLSEEALMAARAESIFVGFAKAQGDLGRTAGSFANRQRIASGKAQNSWQEFGLAMQRPATRVFAVFAEIQAHVFSWVQRVTPTIQGWAQGAAGWFEYFGRQGKTVFAGMVSLLSPVASALTKVFSALWSEGKSVFGAITEYFRPLVTSIFSVGGTLVSALAPAISFVGSAFGAVWGVAKRVWTGVADFFKPVIDGLADMVGSFTEGAGQIAEFFGNGFRTVQGWIGVVWNALKSLANSPFIQGFISTFKPVGDLVLWVRDAFATAFTAIAAGLRNFSTIAMDVGLTLNQWASDAMTLFSWLSSGIAKWTDWFITNFPQAFSDACTNAFAILSSFTSHAKELLGALYDYITSGFADKARLDGVMFNLVFDAGKKFQQTAPTAPSWGELKFDHTGTDAARSKLHDDMAKSEERRLDRIQEAERNRAGGTPLAKFMLPPGLTGPAKPGGLAAKGADAGTAGEGQKVEILKLADLGRKAQESVGKEDTDKKHLKVAEESLEVQKAQLKLAEQPKPAPAILR